MWSPLDILDLYRLVAPEQVLYASDYPYGQQPGSLLLALRTAKIAGLDDSQQRAMLAGSARRIQNGEEPLPLSPPQGPESISQPLTFARIHAVPLDGDPAPLDAPGRHDRRARAGAERLRRALERPA